MRKILLLCCVVLLLAGCHASYENPYRVDTVVRIPVNPTEEPTEPPVTEPVPAQTEPEPTEAPKQITTSGKTSSGSTGKNSTGKSSSGKSSTATKATEPPVTAPTETVPPTLPPFIASEYTPGALEYAVLDLINSCREAEGQAALTMDMTLCEMAAVRSNEAFRSWSHTRPDGRGFETVLEDYDFAASVAAENLIQATGDPDAAVLLEKWMGSDSHRANILSDRFTTVGVGLYEAGGTTYLTVLFVG